MIGARTLVATAAWIGFVPCAALLLMLVSGNATALAVALAMTATIAASVIIAAMFLRDLELLSARFRAWPLPVRTAPLHVKSMEILERGIERLGRTQAAAAAESSNRLLANEAILDRLPDPLLILGSDHTIRRANQAARKTFGSELAAVLRHPGLRGAIERALEQRASQSVDLHFAVPVARDVHATVILIDPPFEDGSAAFAVLSDLTRERAVERMRADFVTNASHELRTPLASLIGFIDTLRGPAADDPPAQVRFLGIMSEQAHRMNRLIDDLLRLSRIELTEHQAPSEQVDLGSLIDSVAASFEPRLQARSVTLAVSVADGLPSITGDHDQIVQVLQNLVDNAISYGKPGGTIRLSAARPASSSEGAGSAARWPARPGIVLAVTDDGPGIPRVHLSRLTERFYRVDKGRSRNAGGTGLGLAIVKHIVNRHRGLLLVESEEGAGATFYVWLPVGTGT